MASTMSAELLRRLLLLLSLMTVPAAAQPSVEQSASAHAPLAFEVTSIRPSKPDATWSIRWQTTADGYHTKGQSLQSTILVAYYPQGIVYWRDRIAGGPSWLNDLYDIDAKVSEADLAAWQKQGVSLDQKPMLQQMLQSMLAERCKLAFHRVPAQIDGFAVEVGKKGSRLQESKRGEVLPQGIPLLSGGVLVWYKRGEPYHASYHHATMDDLAQRISLPGHPVLNRTGLTGQFDFDLGWIGDPDHPERDGLIMPDDPNPLSHFNVEALGLRLVPIKIPIDNLVIDHIEKPSEN